MRVRVQELFHALADLPEEDRLKYFAENDIQPKTQAELNELLSFDSQCTTSLEMDIGQAAVSALEAESRELLCGAYRLGRILGSGGMGSVYCAQRVDGEIAHRVAVKLLRPGANDRGITPAVSGGTANSRDPISSQHREITGCRTPRGWSAVPRYGIYRGEADRLLRIRFRCEAEGRTISQGVRRGQLFTPESGDPS